MQKTISVDFKEKYAHEERHGWIYCRYGEKPKTINQIEVEISAGMRSQVDLSLY